MLQVLFASTRICVVTFDSRGEIVGVNPQTAGFGGRAVEHYRGVSLREHPVLRRLGFGEALDRVLDGETVELTDSRWVTLFSGEERFIDVIAGPVIVEARVVGGIAYLVDVTRAHRAERIEAARRQHARELHALLLHDVSRRVSALAGDSSAEELERAIDDLVELLELESYRPLLERVLLDGTLGPLDGGGPDVAVFADARLLKRLIANINRFRLRAGGGRWRVVRGDGRVALECTLTRVDRLSPRLLSADGGACEEEGAEHGLAAARWMAECMGGTLCTDGATLRLELPAADPLAAAAEV